MNTTPIMDDADALRADMERLRKQNVALRRALKDISEIEHNLNVSSGEIYCRVSKFAKQALEGSGV